jgi:hypothetical protein
MEFLILIAIFAFVAFLVAWVVNSLIGLFSWERPQDTGSLLLDIFLRFFTILELGFIGRILGHVGFRGWSRKWVLRVGLICFLLFLVSVFHHAH